MKKADFDFTEEKVIDACTTWVNFSGFTGEQCGKCKKKANVLVSRFDWTCVCGHRNLQKRHHPHESPDLGPTQAFLRAAYAKAEKRKKAPA